MQSSLDGMVFAQGTKLQNTQPTYLHKNNLYSDWFIKECHLGETMWAGYSAIAPHEVTDDITFLKKMAGTLFTDLSILHNFGGRMSTLFFSFYSAYDFSSIK